MFSAVYGFAIAVRFILGSRVHVSGCSHDRLMATTKVDSPPLSSVAISMPTFVDKYALPIPDDRDR